MCEIHLWGKSEGERDSYSVDEDNIQNHSNINHPPLIHLSKAGGHMLTPHLNLRATVCASLALHSIGGTLERSLNNAGIVFGGEMMTLLSKCGQSGLIAFTLS